MKKFIAIGLLATAVFAAAPAKADDFSFSYYSGYQPYRTYAYVHPAPAYYYSPFGVSYVERRVVRPYYAPIVRSSWHDRRDDRRWNNHHRQDRGHGRRSNGHHR